MSRSAQRKARKSNARRYLASRAFVSKKKRRLGRMKAREANGPIKARQSPGDRSLALALWRSPLRIQRVARALREGGSFKTVVLFNYSAGRPDEALYPNWREVDALKISQMNPGKKKESDAGPSALFREWTERDFAGRDRSWALWDWMARSGADMLARDSRGDGFEHFAADMCHASALMWWRERGYASVRGDGLSLSLPETLLVKDRLWFAETLEKIWPDEGMGEQVKSALGRAPELIQRYWGDPKKGGALSQAAQIRARPALARAAQKIATRYPELIRPNNELSSYMDLLGTRLCREKVGALEKAAMARAERDEIDRALGASAARSAEKKTI